MMTPPDMIFAIANSNLMYDDAPEIIQIQVMLTSKTNHINTFVMFLQMVLFLFLSAKKLQSDLSRLSRHN
jgi:hypothetical protein